MFACTPLTFPRLSLLAYEGVYHAHNSGVIPLEALTSLTKQYITERGDYPHSMGKNQ